jgi:hypothetical protein
VRRRDAEIGDDALRMALGLRQPGADIALVHHSDAGSQYTPDDYTPNLDDHGVLASIGSVGDAYFAVKPGLAQRAYAAHDRPIRLPQQSDDGQRPGVAYHRRAHIEGAHRA